METPEYKRGEWLHLNFKALSVKDQGVYIRRSHLPADDPARKALTESAARHAEAGLKHIASGSYEGEHWLASFAVYALTE